MKPAASSARKAAVMTAATMALSRAAESVPVTQTMTFSASDAFEQGEGGMLVQRDGAGVGLYDRKLVEDDGPGVGYHQPGKNAGIAPVNISGGGKVKKILRVEDPEAFSARLFMDGGGKVTLNGQVVEVSAGKRGAEIPVSLLKKGDNEVIVEAPAEGSLKIRAAGRKDILRNAPERAGQPARSFTTSDGGKTWEPFDGEFMVRLHLLQYAGEGSFVSPVVDLAKGGETGAGAAGAIVPSVTVKGVTIRAEAITPAGTGIAFLVRSGSTPVFEAAKWTSWRAVAADGSAPVGDRYVQWKAVFKTDSALASPVLKSVTVESQVVRERLPAWAQGVHVVAQNNPMIRHTSIPFKYEDPNHPKMAALREKYKLKELVAGAGSELEIFVRLRNWVSGQWKWTPPVENYPDWDADEILSRKYGFCVQHAIVYMQCAIALGYQTRFLFSNNPGNGGHEVCEVWSNEYQKWIYMDSADNFHYVDAKTHIPLSMLETHDMIMRTYFPEPGQKVTYENLPNEKKTTKELGICYGLELKPTGSAPEWSKEKVVNGEYELSRMWTLIRYMPRNNFYGEPDPRPICQGRHWDYSDYIVWQGPKMAKGQWLYRNFTARRSDIDWTLNQVRFEVGAEAEAGKLRMQMGTVTPYLETFLVKTDRTGWIEKRAEFGWELHPGMNRLEMRVRTTSGILGAVSLLEVDYQPG